MRRPGLLLLALALGAMASVLVSCGSSSGLIGADHASKLDRDLDAVSAAILDGQCHDAADAGAAFSGDVLTLPQTIDPRLRSRLKSGGLKLSNRIPIDCKSGGTTTDTTPTDTTPTDTTPTETFTTDTNTVPTETQTLPTETDTTPITTTIPTTTTFDTTTTPGGGVQVP